MLMVLGFTVTGAELSTGSLSERVSKVLRGAPRDEAALKTRAARKRVETEKIIVERDVDFEVCLSKGL